uniref:Uncharacterized protein n=1 Tax=Arcella intermedia TaxID=1963864 RepID=A0A6B2LVQ1_9EUKA
MDNIISITEEWPFLQAILGGVQASFCFASRLALFERSNSTTAVFPVQHAMCKAVQASSCVASMSALWESSIPTMEEWPS